MTPSPTLLPVPHHSTTKAPCMDNPAPHSNFYSWIFWKKPKRAAQQRNNSPLTSDVPAPRSPRSARFPCTATSHTLSLCLSAASPDPLENQAGNTRVQAGPSLRCPPRRRPPFLASPSQNPANPSAPLPAAPTAPGALTTAWDVMLDSAV